MKTGCTISKVEFCTPPKAIEVKNFDGSNAVFTSFWYNYEDCTRDKYSVGVWNVKYKS